MKGARVLCLLLALTLLCGCAAKPAPAQAEATGKTEAPAGTPAPAAEPERTAEPAAEPEPTPAAISDGRDRPSVCGKLCVKNGRLSDQSGAPVMLRGASSYGVSMAERLINRPFFDQLSGEYGANVFRFALYTYGVGVVGYCTGGDKTRLFNDVVNGVEYCRAADMYAIVDWHILSDGDPNLYADEAEIFFNAMSERFAGYDNVLYEICNEPNHVEWSAIKAYAERIIPVIRKNDPEAVIIVGTPVWSQMVDEAAADPLSFGDILYTLHFYSATHKDDLRAKVKAVSEAGLPIFVTEFGITASSGGFPIDIESADTWIDLLEEQGISYCMWSFSKVPEPCSALVNSCMKVNGFTEEDLSTAGKWLVGTIAARGGSR